MRDMKCEMFGLDNTLYNISEKIIKTDEVISLLLRKKKELKFLTRKYDVKVKEAETSRSSCEQLQKNLFNCLEKYTPIEKEWRILKEDKEKIDKICTDAEKKIQDAVKSQIIAETKSENLLKEINDLKEKESFLIKEKNDIELFLQNSENDCKRTKVLNKRLLDLFKKYLISEQKNGNLTCKENDIDIVTEMAVTTLNNSLFSVKPIENQIITQQLADKKLNVKYLRSGKIIGFNSEKFEDPETFITDLSCEDLTVLENLEENICKINSSKPYLLDNCTMANISLLQSDSSINETKNEKVFNKINSAFRSSNSESKKHDYSPGIGDFKMLKVKNVINPKRKIISKKHVKKRWILLKMLISKCHKIYSLLKDNNYIQLNIVKNKLCFKSKFKTNFSERRKSKKSYIFITDKLLHDLKIKLCLLEKYLQKCNIVEDKKELFGQSTAMHKICNEQELKIINEDKHLCFSLCNNLRTENYTECTSEKDLSAPLSIFLNDLVEVPLLLSPLSVASYISDNYSEHKNKYDVAVGVDEIIPIFTESFTQTNKIDHISCSTQVCPTYMNIETQTNFNVKLIYEKFEESKQCSCSNENRHSVEDQSKSIKLMNKLIKLLNYNLKEEIDEVPGLSSTSVLNKCEEKKLKNKAVCGSTFKSNSGMFRVSSLENELVRNLQNIKVRKRCFKCKLQQCRCRKNLKSLVFSIESRLTKLSNDCRKLKSQISNSKIDKNPPIYSKNCDNENNLDNKETFKINEICDLVKGKSASDYRKLKLKKKIIDSTKMNKDALLRIENENKFDKIIQNVNIKNSMNPSNINIIKPVQINDLNSNIFKSHCSHSKINTSDENEQNYKYKYDTGQLTNSCSLLNNDCVNKKPLRKKTNTNLLTEIFSDSDESIEIDSAENYTTFESKLVTNSEDDFDELFNKNENTNILKSTDNDTLDLSVEKSLKPKSLLISKGKKINHSNNTFESLKAMCNANQKLKVGRKLIINSKCSNDQNKKPQVDFSDEMKCIKRDMVESEINIMYNKNVNSYRENSVNNIKNTNDCTELNIYDSSVKNVLNFSEENKCFKLETNQESKDNCNVEETENKKKRKGDYFESMCKKIKCNQTNDEKYVESNTYSGQSVQVQDLIETAAENSNDVYGNSAGCTKNDLQNTVISISDDRNMYLSKEAIDTRSRAQLILKMKPCKTQHDRNLKTQFKSSLSLRNRNINLDSQKNICESVNQELCNKINSQDNMYNTTESSILLTNSSKIAKNKVKKISEIISTDAVTVHINTLLENWSDTNLQEISNKIRNTKPTTLAHLMINIISSDTNVELDKTFTPPAPPLTVTQQRILILISDLESKYNISTLQTIMLSQLQSRILLPANNLWILVNLTRIFIAICRLKFDVERARLMCCDVLYKLNDKAIPVIFIILTSWPEVLPSKESNNGNGLIEVIVQVLFLKKCLKKGYNLRPLHELLTQFYNYKRGEILPSQLCTNLIEQFKQQPSLNISYAVLLLARNQDSQFTYQHILKLHLIPFVKSSIEKYKLLSNNVSMVECKNSEKIIKKTLDLIARLSVMFEIPTDNKIINDVHTRLLQLQDSSIQSEVLIKELFKVSNYFQ